MNSFEDFISTRKKQQLWNVHVLSQDNISTNTLHTSSKRFETLVSIVSIYNATLVYNT